MGEGQYRVYLKEYKKGDQLWENKPHLAFAYYLLVTMFFFFGGMFGLIFLGCPTPILTIYLIGICVICICLAIYRNEMCNISKSTAFVEKDGLLYSVKLGDAYADNDQIMDSDPAIAERVQNVDQNVIERRNHKESYSNALEAYLKNKKLPDGTMEIIELYHPKVERKNAWIISVSYQKGSERKLKKFRNAYTIDFERMY